MATRVVWFSTKKDDPARYQETLKRADEYCELNRIGFNQIVNLALRAFLNLKQVEVRPRGLGKAKVAKAAKAKSSLPPVPKSFEVGARVHCSKGKAKVDGTIERIGESGNNREIYHVRTASNSIVAVAPEDGWSVYQAL